ncbi:unnamed protein product [Amoebophrya sp. A120]|nr:unnamed protein product [Amoebophrya sp. A120]|eukprot:GSA120T00012701001.1
MEGVELLGTILSQYLAPSKTLARRLLEEVMLKASSAIVSSDDGVENALEVESRSAAGTTTTPSAAENTTGGSKKKNKTAGKNKKQKEDNIEAARTDTTTPTQQEQQGGVWTPFLRFLRSEKIRDGEKDVFWENRVLAEPNLLERDPSMLAPVEFYATDMLARTREKKHCRGEGEQQKDVEISQEELEKQCKKHRDTDDLADELIAMFSTDDSVPDSTASPSSARSVSSSTGISMAATIFFVQALGSFLLHVARFEEIRKSTAKIQTIYSDADHAAACVLAKKILPVLQQFLAPIALVARAARFQLHETGFLEFTRHAFPWMMETWTQAGVNEPGHDVLMEYIDDSTPKTDLYDRKYDEMLAIIGSLFDDKEQLKLLSPGVVAVMEDEEVEQPAASDTLTTPGAVMSAFNAVGGGTSLSKSRNKTCGPSSAASAPLPSLSAEAAAAVELATQQQRPIITIRPPIFEADDDLTGKRAIVDKFDIATGMEIRVLPQLDVHHIPAERAKVSADENQPGKKGLFEKLGVVIARNRENNRIQNHCPHGDCEPSQLVETAHQIRNDQKDSENFDAKSIALLGLLADLPKNCRLFDDINWKFETGKSVKDDMMRQIKAEAAARAGKSSTTSSTTSPACNKTTTASRPSSTSKAASTSSLLSPAAPTSSVTRRNVDLVSGMLLRTEVVQRITGEKLDAGKDQDQSKNPDAVYYYVMRLVETDEVVRVHEQYLSAMVPPERTTCSTTDPTIPETREEHAFVDELSAQLSPLSGSAVDKDGGAASSDCEPEEPSGWITAPPFSSASSPALRAAAGGQTGKAEEDGQFLVFMDLLGGDGKNQNAVQGEAIKRRKCNSTATSSSSSSSSDSSSAASESCSMKGDIGITSSSRLPNKFETVKRALPADLANQVTVQNVNGTTVIMTPNGVGSNGIKASAMNAVAMARFGDRNLKEKNQVAGSKKLILLTFMEALIYWKRHDGTAYGERADSYQEQYVDAFRTTFANNASLGAGYKALTASMLSAAEETERKEGEEARQIKMPEQHQEVVQWMLMVAYHMSWHTLSADEFKSTLTSIALTKIEV